MRLDMFKAWAACSSLLASSLLAVATEPDELYDEVVATRLAFAAGPAGFPLLPFDAVAHAAPLGDTTVAVLAHSGTASGSSWGLWVVDTAVSGTSAVQTLNVPSEVPLTGSCLAAGSSSGELFVVAANSSDDNSGGVWALSCDESSTDGAAFSCTASLVASADPALLQVTACAAANFDSGSQAVVAVASPQGLFAATVVLPSAAVGGSSGSIMAPPLQLAKVQASADMSGGAVPDGNPVLTVAVSAGWNNDLGIAIACATHDHLYYASSLSSPTRALPQKDSAGNNHGSGNSGDDSLVWRKEWVSVPQVGGVVDWTTPHYGLTFEPLMPSSSTSSAAPPRLWIGTGKCLQVLDLSLGNMRRLDGPSQGLPFENITAVAFGSPLAATSSGGGRPLMPLATNNELWLGTAVGAVRRTTSLQPGAAATSDAAGTEWRYMNGARWLPGANSHVRQVVAARSGSSSSNGKKNGGRHSGKDGSDVATTCYGCGDGCGQAAAGAVAITLEGLAVWAPQCTSLSAKATTFEKDIPTSRHTRYGLVADCAFTSGNGGGDPNANCTTSSSDNDGLWTSIYAASQIFKAATLARDGEAYSSAFNASVSEAKEKFGALKKLFDVTGRPGCPARSFAKYGEVPLGPVPGDDNARAWYNSSTIPGWIWKGDTSSDEVVGHMFVFSALGALVPPPSDETNAAAVAGGQPALRGGFSGKTGDDNNAAAATAAADALTEALGVERAQGISLMNDLIGGIVANNWTMIDPGLGTPTTWGRWGPGDLNDNHFYADGRGLNSVQILAWLRAAALFTGNTTYNDLADSLKSQDGYGLNAVNAKITTPNDDNFSDDELLFVPLYNHLVFANAASLDPEMLCSLGRSWEQGGASTRSSLWALVHAAGDAIASGALANTAGKNNKLNKHKLNLDVDFHSNAGGKAAVETSGDNEAASNLARLWLACGGDSSRGSQGGTNGAVVGLPYVGSDRSSSTCPKDRSDGVLSRDAATVGWSLRTWALDPVEWSTQNAQRTDVNVAKRTNRFGDEVAQGLVLPVNERTYYVWNGDPFVLDSGALPGGGSEYANGAFLLPYWMARFHGLLAAA